ncbi:hypothetical protein F5884DRAFT_147580 [Xylogone sp. PMI_703]|nr:hypothetical protein F5884DRAFT_147580 [Xylogone sp. PMI_703]
MDHSRAHSNIFASPPNQSFRRSFSQDTATEIGDSPSFEVIHGCTPPCPGNPGALPSNIGNLITYEFTLEKDGRIVATSFDFYPPPTHVIRNSYSANLRKVNSSADWTHNFDIIVGKLLSGLTLGETTTLRILAPFTSGKYGWDEQSLDETEWKECILTVMVPKLKKL